MEHSKDQHTIVDFLTAITAYVLATGKLEVARSLQSFSYIFSILLWSSGVYNTSASSWRPALTVRAGGGEDGGDGKSWPIVQAVRDDSCGAALLGLAAALVLESAFLADFGLPVIAADAELPR